MKSPQTAERVSQSDMSDNYVFQRSILAYHKAAELVSGTVLEIGTGSGYGISVIAPRCDRFVTIDKTLPPEGTIPVGGNTEFIQTTVPPLEQFGSGTFDYVVSFQVIEHIKKDAEVIDEIYRVLKPGGKLIISTPNKLMSLTRNPWHVREYTVSEFKELLGRRFGNIEALGFYGNENVMRYYEKNKASVKAVMKYDILHMQKILPRWLLKIPYDIMNRRNRKKLLSDNLDLTSSITMEDYFFAEADDSCIDLFFIAEKQ